MANRWTWLFPLLLAGACTALTGVSAPGGGAQARPRRVILFIADGAGAAHWAAARLAADELYVDRLPVVGLVDTRSTSPRVTDSAAGATAYSIGMRTFHRAIGVGPDSAPHPTVLEVAEQRGLATGLVTTTSITDATPAAFAAHVPSRYDHPEIARQIARQNVEVLLGGGRDYFDGTEKGATDLLSELRERYAYLETPADYDELRLDTVSALLGLFGPKNLSAASDQQPPLAYLTLTALTILGRDPEGFFLLVETEGSDEAAHDNEPYERIVEVMLDFDRAISVALDYQRRHPETLIVVTADHETGGMAVHYDTAGVRLAYTTREHTAVMVPLFAGGPGAERFGGSLPNYRVGQLLHEAVGGAAAGSPAEQSRARR